MAGDASWERDGEERNGIAQRTVVGNGRDRL